MQINLGTKIKLYTEKDGEHIGIIKSTEESERFRYYYGFLTGKYKNSVFEIVECLYEDRYSVSITWPDEWYESKGYTSSFVEKFDIIGF